MWTCDWGRLVTKFARAQAALIRRQKASNPATIIYTRKFATTPVTLTGWFGRGLQTSSPDGGARTEISEREFFLTVADVTAAGLAEPRVGDRLKVDGEMVTWEIMTPQTGEPAFRFSDAERTMYRIHCQRVK